MDKKVFDENSSRVGFLVVLLVVLLNPWVWKIVPENFFLALLLAALSVCLFKAAYFRKYTTLIFGSIFVLTVLIGFIIFSTSFDRNLFIPTHEEKLRQDSKHLYFSHNLGKIYLNKIGLYFHQNLDLPFYKLQHNFFSNLDPNLYFFASHPRERAGVGEFEKYHFILLPFFVAGIVISTKKKLWQLAAYFGVITVAGAFIRPDYIFGPVLFFPLINTIISLGILSFLKMFNSRKRGFDHLK